ncbi:hypothetical protein Ae505Ps2_6172 [Pseudonocardia sp. Ae505_Ps2]|nr:hypothetical protein Ae505Ps2_6172 [Pseudonocardia sp. Ae505_Ps2]
MVDVERASGAGEHAPGVGVVQRPGRDVAAASDSRGREAPGEDCVSGVAAGRGPGPSVAELGPVVASRRAVRSELQPSAGPGSRGRGPEQSGGRRDGARRREQAGVGDEDRAGVVADRTGGPPAPNVDAGAGLDGHRRLVADRGPLLRRLPGVGDPDVSAGDRRQRHPGCGRPDVRDRRGATGRGREQRGEHPDHGGRSAELQRLRRIPHDQSSRFGRSLVQAHGPGTSMECRSVLEFHDHRHTLIPQDRSAHPPRPAEEKFSTSGPRRIRFRPRIRPIACSASLPAATRALAPPLCELHSIERHETAFGSHSRNGIASLFGASASPTERVEPDPQGLGRPAVAPDPLRRVLDRPEHSRIRTDVRARVDLCRVLARSSGRTRVRFCSGLVQSYGLILGVDRLIVRIVLSCRNKSHRRCHVDHRGAGVPGRRLSRDRLGRLGRTGHPPREGGHLPQRPPGDLGEPLGALQIQLVAHFHTVLLGLPNNSRIHVGELRFVQILTNPDNCTSLYVRGQLPAAGAGEGHHPGRAVRGTGKNLVLVVRADIGIREHHRDGVLLCGSHHVDAAGPAADYESALPIDRDRRALTRLPVVSLSLPPMCAFGGVTGLLVDREHQRLEVQLGILLHLRVTQLIGSLRKLLNDLIPALHLAHNVLENRRETVRHRHQIDVLQSPERAYEIDALRVDDHGVTAVIQEPADDRQERDRLPPPRLAGGVDVGRLPLQVDRDDSLTSHFADGQLQLRVPLEDAQVPGDPTRQRLRVIHRERQVVRAVAALPRTARQSGGDDPLDLLQVLVVRLVAGRVVDHDQGIRVLQVRGRPAGTDPQQPRRLGRPDHQPADEARQHRPPGPQSVARRGQPQDPPPVRHRRREGPQTASQGRPQPGQPPGPLALALSQNGGTQRSHGLPAQSSRGQLDPLPRVGTDLAPADPAGSPLQEATAHTVVVGQLPQVKCLTDSRSYGTNDE